MVRKSFRRGDWVVVRKSKQTTHPGPRAKHIDAAPKGDYYSYVVDKFWIVVDVLSNGRVVLKTRRGKTHVMDPNDPQLRHATLWDRLLHRRRFNQLDVMDHAH